MMAYKNDPAVAGSLQKYEAELAAYRAARHSSRKAFWLACAISVVAIAGLILAAGMIARREINRKADSLRATVAQIQAGDLPGALAIMAKLPEPERNELANSHAFAKIAQTVLNGRDREALDLVRGIPDPAARASAVNFIGGRMLDQAMKSEDYPEALTAAGLLSPETERTKAEDSVRSRQATAFIESNRMDLAKATIANIRDEAARARLEKLIQAKLPKAKLDGF
jgi:heme exporter protein D